MVCETLTQDIDNQCASPARKFDQKVVILNYEDLYNYKEHTTGIDHNVEVVLPVAYNSGNHILSNYNGNNIKGGFTMTRDEGIPRYKHSVSFPIIGVDDKPMSALRQIDTGKYVVFLRFGDGTIKVYGIENGLKSIGYSYEPQSNTGGGIITLESEYHEPYQPLVYSGDPRNFDKDFNNPILNLMGDYNKDYNKDYARNFYL